MKLIRQYEHGLPAPKELLEQSENRPIEEAGVRLRSLMPRVEKEKHQGGAGGFRLSRTIPTTSFASVIEAIRE